MNFYSEELLHLSEWLGSQLQQRSWRLATAESCTGGGLAYALTAVAGSSAWFQGGIVTYSNNVKTSLLQVASADIDRYGAVSDVVAEAMAKGAAALGGVDAAIAVTGIAGPDGGTPDKPVGLVWIGCTDPANGSRVQRLQLDGNRHSIRHQCLVEALKFFLKGL